MHGAPLYPIVLLPQFEPKFGMCQELCRVKTPCFGVTDRGLHILLIIWRALRAVRVKYLNKICLQMHKFTVSHSSVFLLLHTYPCFNPPKPETIFSLCDIFFPYLWLFRIFIFLTVYGYFMNNFSLCFTVLS